MKSVKKNKILVSVEIIVQFPDFAILCVTGIFKEGRGSQKFSFK